MGEEGRPGHLARCAALGHRVGLSESRRFVVPWDVVEQELGTLLPDAYKAFIEYFGPGSFAEELQYFTPGIESSALELVHIVQDEHIRWSSTPGRALLPGYIPFPEPSGLLKFAWIGDLAAALWQTGSADPNMWSIVVNRGSINGDFRFDGDFLDLVAAMLDDAPSVEGLDFYYPELMATFWPGDGRISEGANRVERLEPISRFADEAA